MSTTRDVINLNVNYSKHFINKFGFYLDSYDKIYHIQSKIGVADLDQFSESDQNIMKSYLFLMESANTTSSGTHW